VDSANIDWLICLLATIVCCQLQFQNLAVAFHNNSTINIFLLLLLLLLFIAYVFVCTEQAFIACDPRFDDLSGEFKESYFKQSYGFLSDIKLREKQVHVFVISQFVF